MITKQRESFANARFEGVPSGLLSMLDRMFFTVLDEPGPEVTSLSGFMFRPTDKINSLLVDTTAGNVTIYLPISPTGNRRRTVTKKVAANTITIDGNGSLINGATTITITNQYYSYTFEPTGTGWIIVAAYP